MKYVQKPVEVEAIRLGERPLISEDWFWDAVTANKIITHNFGKGYPPAWCEIIDSNRQSTTAVCGDYIILEPSGEISVCKADSFEARHTPFSF